MKPTSTRGQCLLLEGCQGGIVVDPHMRARVEAPAVCLGGPSEVCQSHVPKAHLLTGDFVFSSLGLLLLIGSNH